jgi:hypothetical protein
VSREDIEAGPDPADNRKRADQALRAAKRRLAGPGRDHCMQEAQVYATLAVADELRKLIQPTVRYTDPSPARRSIANPL